MSAGAQAQHRVRSSVVCCSFSFREASARDPIRHKNNPYGAMNLPNNKQEDSLPNQTTSSSCCSRDGCCVGWRTEAALAACVVNDIYSEDVVATHIERLYVSPVKLNREQHGMTHSQDSAVDGNMRAVHCND